MFKILYVLVSSGNDIYSKQLEMSIISLRNQMSSIDINVLVDDITYDNLIYQKSNILQLANVKKIEIKDSISLKEKSRFLKTSMRNLIDGDFLYIDTDTAICQDFSDYYNNEQLAMVKDLHRDVTSRIDIDALTDLNKKCNYDISGYKTYYNSGVIWARDTSQVRDFFKLWHKEWLRQLNLGVCVDQPSLNYVNEKCMNLIRELPAEWNCQVSSENSGIKYLLNAKIIHYYNFNDGPYLLGDRDFVKSNYGTKDIERILMDPKSGFADFRVVKYDSTTSVFMRSNTFKVLKSVHNKSYMLWNLIEQISCVIITAKKLLKGLLHNV